MKTFDYDYDNFFKLLLLTVIIFKHHVVESEHMCRHTYTFLPIEIHLSKHERDSSPSHFRYHSENHIKDLFIFLYFSFISILALSYSVLELILLHLFLNTHGKMACLVFLYLNLTEYQSVSIKVKHHRVILYCATDKNRLFYHD